MHHGYALKLAYIFLISPQPSRRCRLAAIQYQHMGSVSRQRVELIDLECFFDSLLFDENFTAYVKALLKLIFLGYVYNFNRQGYLFLSSLLDMPQHYAFRI